MILLPDCANASIRPTSIDQLILFGGFAPVNGVLDAEMAVQQFGLTAHRLGGERFDDMALPSSLISCAGV